MTDTPFGDALTAPYWEAAERHELLVQRCSSCGESQLYPRPFCLACRSDAVEWVMASGAGVIYSMTTVRLALLPELEPPYAVALVDLDEGPRIVTNVPTTCEIGQRVFLGWRAREDGPPLAIFDAGEEGADGPS